MAKHSNGTKTVSKHGVKNKNNIGNPLTALFISNKNSKHAAPSTTDKTVKAVKQKTLPLVLTASFITGAGIITSTGIASTSNAAGINGNNIVSTVSRPNSLYSTVSRSETRTPLTNTNSSNDSASTESNGSKTSKNVDNNVSNDGLSFNSDKTAAGVTVENNASWGGIEDLNVPYTKSAAEKRMDAINARNADKYKIISDALKNNPNPSQPIYLQTKAPLTLDNEEAMLSYNAHKPDSFNVNHDTGDTNGNAYPFSQCTWWAYKRRHDLGLPAGSYFGDGRMWYDSANSKGYWTSIGSPMVGDIISFKAGESGSDSYFGHVAIVEAVDSNGNILTSESGASYNGDYFSRVFTADMVKNMRFIHI